MANIVISRIQHRRGRRENLPQPLSPAELALTGDTSQVWIGADPDLAVPGVTIYQDKNGTLAQSIIETSIVEIQFTTAFDASDFNAVVTQLLDVFGPAGTNQITSDDILWDGVTTVHVAADPDIDPNLGADIINEINTNNPPDFSAVDFLSTGVSPFDREFVDRTLLLDNHTEAANVSKLINRIHGSTPGEVTGLVSTNLNIEITSDSEFIDGELVGFRNLPVESTTGSPVTLGDEHAGKGLTRASGTTDITVDNTNPIGYITTIASIDASAIINLNASGVTITSFADGTSGNFVLDSTVGVMTIWKVADALYFINGVNFTIQPEPVLCDPLNWEDASNVSPPEQWEAINADMYSWDDGSGFSANPGVVTYIGAGPLPASITFYWEVETASLSGDIRLIYKIGSDPEQFEILVTAGSTGTGNVVVNIGDPGATFYWGVSTSSDPDYFGVTHISCTEF